MTQLPAGYLVHEIRGRCRIRIPERRGDAAFFEEAAHTLAECRGVDTVTANPLTGAVLVTHAATAEAIGDHAAAAGLFALLEDRPPPPARAAPPTGRARSLIGAANRRLVQASAGRADLWSGLAALLVVYAIVQMVRGRVAVPAITLLWYALTAFTLGRHFEDEATERETGD